jgi:hypothetical protein
MLDVWFAKKLKRCKFLGHAVIGTKKLLFSSPFFAAADFSKTVHFQSQRFFSKEA